MPATTPYYPCVGVQHFSPRSFQKARQRFLPFPARIGLRQLRAPANSDPERGMQITTLGTVNKVLNKA